MNKVTYECKKCKDRCILTLEGIEEIDPDLPYRCPVTHIYEPKWVMITKEQDHE